MINSTRNKQTNNPGTPSPAPSTPSASTSWSRGSALNLLINIYFGSNPTWKMENAGSEQSPFTLEASLSTALAWWQWQLQGETIINIVFITIIPEMEKRADTADISVLFLFNMC